MEQAIRYTNYTFPGQTSVYHGKVRDVYTIHDKYIVMVASDRISAFDVILPKPVPFKGQVLNQMAAYFLRATRDIVPNWLMDVPDPRVSVGLKCEPVRVEMVVRGYLSGHAWREYKAGKRTLCGAAMPEGLRESDKLPQPIITPSTKAEAGHDEDITPEEIVQRGIAGRSLYEQMEKYALQLFQRGTEMAAKVGLILVDTKYEFGLYEGALYIMDEVHTADSSRYFYADGYADRQAQQMPQKQLSKEFVREWLMENHFMGQKDQQVPDMPDDFVQRISDRYIELYERITGRNFAESPYSEADTYRNILRAIEQDIYHQI